MAQEKGARASERMICFGSGEVSTQTSAVAFGVTFHGHGQVWCQHCQEFITPRKDGTMRRHRMGKGTR